MMPKTAHFEGKSGLWISLSLARVPYYTVSGKSVGRVTGLTRRAGRQRKDGAHAQGRLPLSLNEGHSTTDIYFDKWLLV